MSYRSGSDEPNPFIKVIAKALAVIVIAVLMWIWEFAFNPNQHYSVEVKKNDVVVVEDLGCRGDYTDWQFTLEKAWYSSKKNRGQILAWTNGSLGPTNAHRFEVVEGQDVTLPTCGDRREKVAYIWSIGRDQLTMHLRVPPNLKVHADPELNIPQIQGE